MEGAAGTGLKPAGSSGPHNGGGGGYWTEASRQEAEYSDRLHSGGGGGCRTMAGTHLKRGELQLGKLTVVNVAEVRMVGACGGRVWGAGVSMGPMQWWP